ncbi:BTAD domain-containing putative transcriptional regulator [Nonomuraea sp. NPDC050556]|uniref:AfsR/SARP family transcriptional regulator n=1 Tax=Nonomuraea sp. NPDC050556 TaxID=3364369 RepID=UPI00379DD603
MKLTVLGPVAISADGRQVSGAAPRHRAVLAYLLLHARTVISTERLIGAMWGHTTPDTARSQLHASIAAVRQVLRQAGAGEILQTRSAGYVIVPEPGQLDMDEFTRLVAEANATEDRNATSRLLRQALALWQGQPLAGMNADYVGDAVRRLEERRLAAVERMIEVELDLGRHADLVEELTAHVAEHPLRERLSGQLMLALHRSGRQVDALAAGRAFRERLVEEQGLDPSRTFLDLERSILSDAPAAREASSFLPFDIPDFTGRAEELDRLADSWAANGGVVTISAIDGMAGIGKTTLAVHTAHRLAGRFPDGQLFVDLHAHTAGQRPMEPAVALETLLRQLGVPSERIPQRELERAALWRTELVNRRVLVVVDNVLDADHVRALLPGASHSLMLITSRRRLVDLDGAFTLSLEVLPAQDAITLFTSIVGARAVEEPTAVLDVLQLCGFLPLAVRIAAARLRHRPRWSVAYLAERLRDQRRRLSELSTSERGVAAAFTLSYQQLDEAQQRLFRLLGLHPGTDFEPYAAAALAGIPADDAEQLLEELLDAHMLLQHEPGRYTFHDLLRDHARSAAEQEGDEPLTRLFDQALYAVCTASDLLFPDFRQLRPTVEEPKSETVRLRGEQDASAWLESERANLAALAARGVEQWAGHTIKLAAVLHRYLFTHAHYADARSVQESALAASRLVGDAENEARALINLGGVYWKTGQYGQAHDNHRAAMELCARIGDRIGEARASNNLGLVYEAQGEYDLAYQHHLRAVELCRETGDRGNEAASLGNLGIVLIRQGRYEEARGHCLEALALYREVGDLGGETSILTDLGMLCSGLGDYQQARDYLGRALLQYRELGFPNGEVEALLGLGDVALAAGDAAAGDEAVGHYSAALAIATAVGTPLEEAQARRGLAAAHRALGRPDLARSHEAAAAGL